MTEQQPQNGHSNKTVLQRKVEHWKKQLLDLSKRNKMINYREAKRATLKILEPEFTELFNRLAVSEEELTFQRPVDKDSDLRTFSMLSLLETLSYPIPVHAGDVKAEGSLLERRIALNNLRLKSKLARDEQGTNILYLSFGFIEWRENNTANAQWLKSPVLMMPVSLKLESIKAPYTLLRYDDDIEVNPTLDYLFNERYGIDLPAFELSGEESIGQYMRTIEEIADRHGWKLIREVSLGLLSFLKISMYHDLNNNYERMRKNPVVRAITGDAGAAADIPRELTGFDFDRVPPSDCYQVVDSDSSQQEAILLSKAGVSFVMQGPPGTGKSQTITNIIAEALAGGKTVLFVSEKAAALQVVYKRLTEVGLDDFCLALHSHKANKKEILDSIAANLKLPRKRLKDGVMSELAELFQDRQALNQYAAELHADILPLEKSLYEAFGELSLLQEAPDIQFFIESAAAVSASTYNAMLYRTGSYAKALKRLGIKLSENPWRGAAVKMVTQRFKEDLARDTDGLAESLLALGDAFSAAAASLGSDETRSWSGVNRVIGLLQAIENTPLFPLDWAESGKRAFLLAKAKNGRQARKEYLQALVRFKEALFSADLTSWLENVRQGVLKLNRNWFDPAARQRAKQLLKEARSHISPLVEMKNALLETWEVSALGLNSEEMLLRFKTEHTSFFKIFKPSYRADIRAIKGVSKKIGAKFSNAEIVALLQQISAIKQESLWLSENRQLFTEYFGNSYEGETTDWAAIETGISLAEKMLSLFSQADLIQAKRAALKQICADHKEFFGRRIEGLETSWDSIIADLESVSALLTGSEASLMTGGFTAAFCDDAQYRSKLKAVRSDLQSHMAECAAGYTKFKSLFEAGADFDDARISDSAARIAACQADLMLLDDWIACAETRNACDEIGLADFTEQIERRDNSVEDVVGAFKRGFLTLWIQAVIGGKKTVEQFRRHNQDEKIKRFAALDEKQLLIARERVRQNVVSGIPDPNRALSANDELSILQREIGKKRRIMPLRKLFKSIPNLLLKLKPCMMMSPLSVAYFLEAGSYEFDMVIFDEASQIFPQDAVGSVFRGKQVVIAGDSKQLPPTNFFAISTSNDDGGFDEDDDETAGTEIYDSILEETSGVLPSRTLLWHYRSKYENLIAFSNQEIYKNELVTFPSSVNNAADTGVEFDFVENGVYEGKGRNTAEARRCVELVRRHIDRTPDRSLGVVAFSESQQKVIALEIQKFREQHPEYESFFTEDKEDEFFVKNLENVQGDERDAIIFSVSYAKTKEQRDNNRSMALRFGPLGQKGGERRLNVAVTRAKRNIKLVSSILPADIDLSRTGSEGVKMLRLYIEFALNGSSSLRGSQSETEKDVFLDIVAEYLTGRGYKIKKYVGCSGYKIDLAVLDPDGGDRFAAGIECDGLSYAAAKSARDRDRLRKSVLEAMGWRIYRVWSPEWMARRDIEQQKLTAFIDAAIKEYRETKTAEPPEPAAQIPAESFAESFAEEIEEHRTNNASAPTAALDEGPRGFTEYVEALWYETPKITQLRGDDMIAAAIRHIVGIEQPIYIDLLYQRMTGALGHQKATAAVRKAVEQAMRESKLQSLIARDQDGFVTLAGFKELKARVPAAGKPARQINFISPAEIGAAMLIVAEQTIGLTPEGLIDATVKAMGYARKGERMTACMNDALERLIRQGRLKIVDEKVRVIGGKSRG
ncbi:MAG: DUF4011 domain-containing protein [Gracilibacteraceae bacterium]|jgi:very-short-patch-repair endonuclease|nr:DUF4011 domain-containing protein [Gracilibacteraceae bacterium]